jgi:hypothetical protein
MVVGRRLFSDPLLGLLEMVIMNALYSLIAKTVVRSCWKNILNSYYRFNYLNKARVLSLLTNNVFQKYMEGNEDA